MLLRLVQRGVPTVVVFPSVSLCPALSSPTAVVDVRTVAAVRALEMLKSGEGGVGV